MAKNLKLPVFLSIKRYLASASKNSYVVSKHTQVKQQTPVYEDAEEVVEEPNIFKPTSIRYHVCQERIPVHKMVRSKDYTVEEEKLEQNMRSLQPSALQDYYRSGKV